MLDVRCPEHLEEVREFAKSIGKDRQLEEILCRLNNFGGNFDFVRTVLTKDFAPHSFYFECITKKDGLWMNGGVIYHDYNGGSWSIHT